jgi:hypothetical protein
MTTQLLGYLLLLAFWFQNPTLEVQNATLQKLIQNTPKLALDPTNFTLQGMDASVLAGTVSWVAAGRNGLIYLLIQLPGEADPVIVMDRSGKVVRTWGKGMYTTAHSIRIDPQGNVWTTDAASSMVYKFTPEGKKLMEFEVGGQPTPCGTFCSVTDIAFAPNGNLFIADGYKNARILEYSPEAKKIREWGSAGSGPGQFKLPHSIQIDENGVVYVADRENGRIQRFDLTGKYIGEWSQYGKTFGLTLNKGAIWLTSIPRGPNGTPGWLIKLDRKTGSILGYINSAAVHGLEVLPDGDVITASPARGEFPVWFRMKKR